MSAFDSCDRDETKASGRKHRWQHVDEATLAAVKAALAAMAAGDIGVPIEEFEREFRAQHGMHPRR